MSALESVVGLPSWHPPREVLQLAELVLSGAATPAAVLLVLPEEYAGAAAVALEDAEGTPVAVLRRPGAIGEGELRFEPVRAFTGGPVRSARRSPVQVRAELAAGPTTAGVLAVPVVSMLRAATVDAVLARAAATGQALLWLAVFGVGRPAALPADGLWRAVREISEQAKQAGLHSVAVPVAIPLTPDADSRPAADDVALVESVARAYGATALFDVLTEPAVPAEPGGPAGPAGPVAGPPHPVFEREHERAVPPPHRRGVTIFFTGLSGSGKSTVAKALADALGERSARTVSLLDGDEVRRMLSAGLGFSRADRDLNIRRIGYVATEVNRHGGLAICAPIAPFARTRAQVRASVEEVGDFVLVHVSTPLAECERRDRKGLYAKARRGEIADFTGISSPYEVPVDADLRLDTSRMDVGEAVLAVWTLLADRGYLDRPEPRG